MCNSSSEDTIEFYNGAWAQNQGLHSGTSRYPKFSNSACIQPTGKKGRAPCFPSTCDFPVSSWEDVNSLQSDLPIHQGCHSCCCPGAQYCSSPYYCRVVSSEIRCSQTNQHKYTFCPKKKQTHKQKKKDKTHLGESTIIVLHLLFGLRHRKIFYIK